MFLPLGRCRPVEGLFLFPEKKSKNPVIYFIVIDKEINKRYIIDVRNKKGSKGVENV